MIHTLSLTSIRKKDQSNMETYYSSSRTLRPELRAVALMLILVAVTGTSTSSRCTKEETNGLLVIKAAFESANSSYGLCFPDSNWNNMDDCCSWEGVVVCSNINNTSRVTQLWLNFTRCFDDDYNAVSAAQYYLNASLFLPFEELQLLDLSDNSLSGLNGTLRLKKLQSLRLGGNEMNHVPYLAKLPSLKEVSLYRNPLKTLLPLQGLKLELLNLQEIDSHTPEYNLSIIWEMTSLKALSVEGNSLNSWPEGLCGLVNLEELDISGNAFHSSLPPCLMNMTSLRALELMECDFQGTIPYDFFSRFSSLEFISLSYNAFQGSISLASFGNASKIEVFQLRDNTHQLSIETENPMYYPLLAQLKSLRISNCLLNKQSSGTIPSFLLTQHELIELELSHCGVQGDFPNWLLQNNTHLWYLDLTDNFISGNLDFNYNSSSTLNPNLWYFDVSSNLIQETLPSNILSMFPNLDILNISNNMLHGNIPSLGETGYLIVLDLSSNNFTGELPGTLFDGFAMIELLKLSDNNLSGKLPLLYGSVESIYLDGNSFTGDVSSLLLNNSDLDTLDVSNNRLTGIISGEHFQSLRLQYLVVSNNDLKGSLPLSFCKLENLVFLDLSGNDIGPEMPPCTNISNVMYLHLQSTNLRGLLPKFLQSASSLVTLDLRGNTLSGEVSPWIGMLLNLRVLVLQGNNFSGPIPQKICHLNKLSILDLSVNHFSGGIPSCLNNLTFGKREGSLDSLDTSLNSGTSDSGYHYGKLHLATNIINIYTESENFEAVSFLSKKRLETYKGTVLEYMSGLDLSSNNLSGTIPPEIGWLTQLHALNLSHNHLTGNIPITFRNMEQIESLDVSYNTLNGEIPPQLIELFGLSLFSVAHNNLSGRTPERKNQFSTFDQTSYEGNPLLCGLPLKSCVTLEDLQPESSYDSETEVNPFKDVFWRSSAGAYPVAFIVTILVLYLNSYFKSPGL